MGAGVAVAELVAVWEAAGEADRGTVRDGACGFALAGEGGEDASRVCWRHGLDVGDPGVGGTGLDVESHSSTPAARRAAGHGVAFANAAARVLSHGR